MLIFPTHQFINLFNLLILSSIHSFSQHIHPFTLFTCVRFFFLDRFIRKPCKLSHLYFTSQKFEFINKFPEKKIPRIFQSRKKYGSSFYSFKIPQPWQPAPKQSKMVFISFKRLSLFSNSRLVFLLLCVSIKLIKNTTNEFPSYHYINVFMAKFGSFESICGFKGVDGKRMICSLILLFISIVSWNTW